jgi:hypothetical protein
MLKPNPITESKLDSISNNSSRSFLSKLLVITFLLLTFAGWNRPFAVDDLHTCLESIGQVAFLNSTGKPINQPIQNSDFWLTNSFLNVWKAAMINENGNMMVNQYLTNISIHVFGTSKIFLIGFPSIIGFMLTILLSYKLAEMLFDKNIARWTSLLCAFNPTLFELANIKRSYSIAIALGLLSCILFFRITKRHNLHQSSNYSLVYDAFCYALVALSGFFAHFQTVFLLIGHVIFAGLYIRDKKTWICLITSGLLFSAMVIFWMMELGGALAMQSYSKLNQYIDYKAEKEQIYMFGEFSPRNMAATILSNILYFFGLEQIMPSAKVIRKSPLIFFPIALFLVNYRNILITSNNHSRSVIFVLICTLVTPFFSFIRSVYTSNLFGMQNLYQSFSIPYILCLTGICFSSNTQNPSNSSFRYNSFLKSSLISNSVNGLMIIAIFFSLVCHLYRYNSFVNKNQYQILAQSIKNISNDNQDLIIHVPNLLDAQLLSFFGVPMPAWTFVIEKQAEMDQVVDDRIKKIKIEAQIVRFLEYLRFPDLSEKSNFYKIEIKKIDKNNIFISR